MSWSSRRKSLFGFGFALIAIIFIGIPLFKIFYVEPTCFDGIKNQNEVDVDCGGKCARVCASSFLSPRIEWSRADKITDGVYNLAAYIVNPNLDGAAINVPYSFKAYDKDARLVGEKNGYLYIPPHKNTLAFQSGILTKSSSIQRVTFEFSAPIEWKKTKFQNDGIIVSDKSFDIKENSTILNAKLKNTTVNDYKDFDVFAVLYDEDKNEIGFSKTKVDLLSRGGEQEIEFTWPVKKEGIITTEILPNINVF